MAQPSGWSSIKLWLSKHSQEDDQSLGACDEVTSAVGLAGLALERKMAIVRKKRAMGL